MNRNLATRSSTATEGALRAPKGEAIALTNKGVPNPQSTSITSGSGTSGREVEDDRERLTTVVQFSLLYDGNEEKFAHLWAMRDVMHRVLNTAISEWHRADKVQSKKNPEKETLDRGPVTEKVKDLLFRERSYWDKQIPVRLAVVDKFRVALGTAKSKGKPDKEIEEAEKALKRAQNDVLRTRVKAAIRMPSSVYDSAVRWTQARFGLYAKDAFRGARSLDSFRAGQPIRWRDGSWGFAQGERRGTYRLELELSSDGKRIERGSFVALPDGPSMYAFAKKMVDADALARKDVKLCDARVVYSEKKKQWFAKLTIRYARSRVVATGTAKAALRRGMHNAFVIAFEDGRVEYISGGDVLHFKRKLKARKVSIGKHKNQLEAGHASRGRGKTRREQALRKIHDAEDRFIDAKCKQWAADIAKMCRVRGVGTLLVPKVGKAEMFDGDEYVQALLYQWPFARMLGNVKQALSKEGIAVDEYVPHFDARRCPNEVGGKRCGHINSRKAFTARYEERRRERVDAQGRKVIEIYNERVAELFHCEKCGFERPVDQIVAWNGLMNAVGVEPMQRAKKAQAATTKTVLTELKDKKDDNDDDDN